jgi:hypothetical protein
VAGAFIMQARGGQPPRLVVDERNQSRRGAAVAGPSGIEKMCQVGHECRVYRRQPAKSSINS